ncbi:hypothetical protein [Conexibacter sp. SYSU D00693]|uniref:hypothetical protein n=1 Tax=Conexibacter sp. SYSU D00693 TaxID=2812560 RepID=UPI00196A9F79|nr:hypothetical protein [Conexibacter sp. SYSU D00693]
MTGRSGFLDPGGPLTGASDGVFWFTVAATMLMVAWSVLYAAREAHRLRSALPLVVLASATTWLPNEPFIDAVLGFQYAADAPATLFTLAGREIPITALGIGAMFSMFTWWLYQQLLAGTTERRIVVICILAGVIDWPFEWIAISGNVFEYYGDNPSRVLGLPITSMVQNCFLFLFMACVLALAAPHLRGWRSLLFLPVIPGCYYAAAFVCTWPAYLALHGGASEPPFLVLAGVSAVLNAAIPLAMLRIVAPLVRRDDAPPAPPAPPSRPAEPVLQPV